MNCQVLEISVENESPCVEESSNSSKEESSSPFQDNESIEAIRDSSSPLGDTEKYEALTAEIKNLKVNLVYPLPLLGYLLYIFYYQFCILKYFTIY